MPLPVFASAGCMMTISVAPSSEVIYLSVNGMTFAFDTTSTNTIQVETITFQVG